MKSCPFNQILVVSSIDGNTSKRQSAGDTSIESLSGAAIGRAPGFNLREKKSLKVE